MFLKWQNYGNKLVVMGQGKGWKGFINKRLQEGAVVMTEFCDLFAVVVTWLYRCPSGSWGNETICNAGDVGDTDLTPGLGRALGVGNGNPLWYSRLGNPMDRGAWWATVHGVTKGRTQLGIHATQAGGNSSDERVLCLVCYVIVTWIHRWHEIA